MAEFNQSIEEGLDLEKYKSLIEKYIKHIKEQKNIILH